MFTMLHIVVHNVCFTIERLHNLSLTVRVYLPGKKTSGVMTTSEFGSSADLYFSLFLPAHGSLIAYL